MDVSKLKLNLNEIFKKYANNKNLYIIVIIGVVFMLMSGSGQKREDSIKAYNYDSYSDEERLADILSKIDGAGKVSVMITYCGTTSYDVAFEKKQNSTSSENQSARSEESSVITSNGSPLVKGEVYPKAKGVVIIAEGAGSITVKKKITDAPAAALDIASFKICVLDGKEGN